MSLATHIYVNVTAGFENIKLLLKNELHLRINAMVMHRNGVYLFSYVTDAYKKNRKLGVHCYLRQMLKNVTVKGAVPKSALLPDIKWIYYNACFINFKI
jgi:hypothetical protein